MFVPSHNRRNAQSSRRRSGWLWLVAIALLVLPGLTQAALIPVGGPCTLTAAILAANADAPAGSCPAGSGADRIELGADVELTAVHNTIDGANGLPSITSDVTITGPSVKISRNAGSPAFRILHVASTGRLTLDGVEISGGSAVEGPGASGNRGGGIFNLGRLTLFNTSVVDNEAKGDFYSAGGGIYSTGTSSASILNSLIDSNLAHSTVGSSANGGGVFFATTQSSGLDSGLIVKDSTISNNNALASGSTASGGGIWLHPVRTSEISHSTIFNNGATAPSGKAFGGGINSLVNVDLVDSTISTNRAISKAGVESRGAGVAMEGYFFGHMNPGSVRNVTFRGNVVSPRPVSVSAALYADALVTVSGSIFSGSTGDHCDGAFLDGGGNLADNTTCTGTIAGTLIGVDPALSDNGGPTKTHALVAGSTAIDIAGDCGPVSDQRGAGRVDTCDAGAYEVIGCAILELDFLAIALLWQSTTCNTALLGPALIVESGGRLEVTAGWGVAIKNDFAVMAGGELEITIDPSLLLP